MIALWAALVLAFGYGVLLLVKPDWTLAAPTRIPYPWLRETAWLYAAAVFGFVVAGTLIVGVVCPPPKALAIGGIVAITLSAVIDFKRLSIAGMAFDLAVFVTLVVAVAGP